MMTEFWLQYYCIGSPSDEALEDDIHLTLQVHCIYSTMYVYSYLRRGGSSH